MIWPILKDKALKQRLPLSTVVAEVFHLIVLDAFFAVPESQHICFQGGTSIHLLYGGYRFSEDLDFAGKNLDGKLAQKIITKS
ncbi:MAG TPA: nucleotidyl transferase AbiEii/AbiGii toxin family protein, partial [Acidobacteriota bacterium]|nr:nucleotidyl transferase AbiEii/AbiGii toxin family protein [Acidobacteriota bacterium]